MKRPSPRRSASSSTRSQRAADPRLAVGGDRHHATRRAAPRDLLLVGPVVLQRPERLEHGPRIALVPLRGKGQRLADGAATVRARELDLAHQPCRAPVREEPQQLEDRRRAADLPLDLVRRGHTRCPETGNRPAGRLGHPYAWLACAKTRSSA